MSISTGNNRSDEKTSQADIASRKQNHIEICKDNSGPPIEGGLSSGFAEISFVHAALPELSLDQINTEIEFLNRKISLPLFISCMTGGSEEGLYANRELAKAAGRMNIPIGLGSMRILLEDSRRLKDFQMRSFAGKAPILANLGAQQARDIEPVKIKTLLKDLEADALVCHLNCGQELFQSGGDRCFRGLFDAIGRVVEKAGLPVIVKETGFGIRPNEAQRLIDLGVHYVDVAGAGGTNWILVEKNREATDTSGAEEFASWGIPTAMLLDAARPFAGKILASGGLRSGMDLAKSIALGAVAGGMALPFIQAALKGGSGAVTERIREIGKTLCAAMLLTQSETVSALQNTPLIKSLEFEHYVKSLQSNTISQ